MSTREFFIRRWEDEYPTFLKVFRALAQDQPDYRPHPRSRSAAELIWLLTQEEQACGQWVSGNDVEWKESPAPRDLGEIVSAYEKAHNEMDPLLKSLDDEAWERPVKLLIGGKDADSYEFPLGEMLWYAMIDAIHHRGQLSLYIRLQGGKVPPIYGSSADEKMT